MNNTMVREISSSTPAFPTDTSLRLLSRKRQVKTSQFTIH
jgi:hypothetical protein